MKAKGSANKELQTQFMTLWIWKVVYTYHDVIIHKIFQ